MLSVTILAVGKLKERYLTDACQEYAKRLGAFCKLQILEVEEYRLPEHPSPAQIRQGIEEEGRLLEAKIPQGSHVIALCIEGRSLSSEELAHHFEELTVGGTSAVTLLIGGSNGLWEHLKQRAGLRLSMSRMTFPHQLARVMLLEQLYRAMSITRGYRYHK